MKYRTLGKTGFKVSEVSLGTWQLGGKWGTPFDEAGARETLEVAYKHGVRFIDTADCYKDRMSEKVVGDFVKAHPDVHYTTKIGRRLNPHNFEGYNEKNLRNFVFEALDNMGVKSLDCVLLHCPPSAVYENGEVFKAMDRLKEEGHIQNYGVSVEKVSEALKAMEYENVSCIEVIYNMFRLKPAEELFSKAKKNNVGIIVRVPLASGLLSGKFGTNTVFGPDDHRSFNRNGEAFDKGETFSGVKYDLALKAVDELKQTFGDKLMLKALKFTLMNDAVSTVIPGASSYDQIAKNVEASEEPELTAEELEVVRNVYEKYIKAEVHNLW